MSKDDYRIWSNADLDYEEWKDWMEEEYPTLSDDERVAMMYEETGTTLRTNGSIWTFNFPSPFWLLPIWGFGMAGARDTKKFPAAISAIVFTLITITPHGMWTETETFGVMTPTMTAQTIISIGYIRTMFPRRRKTGSKKKSTTAQPQGQILPVSPAGSAMRSGRCTAGTFPLVRGSEVRHDEPPLEGGKVFER